MMTDSEPSDNDACSHDSFEQPIYFWSDAVRFKTVRRLLSYAQTYSIQSGWVNRRELAGRIDMNPRQVRTHMDKLLMMNVYEERTTETEVKYRPRIHSQVVENLREVEDIIENNIDDGEYNHG